MSISGYSLTGYGRMITCEPRMSAYAEALERSIFPGAIVIDIGAGPGLFALLACQMGAGKVIAIEPDSSIEVARRAAADNGFSDRITFVSDLSTNFDFPEKADVVISDIRGVLPLFEHHIATIRDARTRLLKPGGILIPGTDRIYAALVEAPDVYDRYRKPWLENNYSVDLSACYDYAINGWSRTYQDTGALLTAPELIAELDYQSVGHPDCRATVHLCVRRPGIAHGILVWFETELVPGIGYSNAPGAPEQVYGQGFFPLERPVELAEHTTAQVKIAAKYVNGDYVWSWSFQGADTAGQYHFFRQSTFKNAILTREMLSPRAATYCPSPSSEQEIDVACISLFDGLRSVMDIAEILFDKFPAHFRDKFAALDRVAMISARYYHTGCTKSAVTSLQEGR